VVSPLSAVLIGLIAGSIVVGSVMFFDRIRIDDPVGAISVHLVCGIWGTLAVGIFSTNPEHSLGIQAVGVLAYGAFAATSAFALFFVINAVMGIRVSEEEELEGLDISEHGMHAYDFGTTGRGIADEMFARRSQAAPAAATSQLAEQA
jgi:Amt family ammonium transporter